MTGDDIRSLLARASRTAESLHDQGMAAEATALEEIAEALATITGSVDAAAEPSDSVEALTARLAALPDGALIRVDGNLGYYAQKRISRYSAEHEWHFVGTDIFDDSNARLAKSIAHLGVGFHVVRVEPAPQ